MTKLSDRADQSLAAYESFILSGSSDTDLAEHLAGTAMMACEAAAVDLGRTTLRRHYDTRAKYLRLFVSWLPGPTDDYLADEQD